MIIYNNSWQRRKKIVAIALGLCCLLILFFCCLPQTYAGHILDDNTITGDQIYDLLDNIFGSYGNSRLINLLEDGKFDSSDGNSVAGIGTLLTTISASVKDLAYFFLVLIIVVKAIQEASRGDPTLETWLRMFMVAIVGIIFIEYSDTIFDYLSDLGDKFVDLMRADIQEAEDVELGFDDDDTIFFSLSSWKKVIIRIIIWALKFALVVPCWQLFYELALRRIFAPIAVVDVAAEGLHSNGLRYMKNYFGIFIRIIICYFAGYIMSILLQTVTALDGWFIKLVSVFGIMSSGTHMMAKSQQLVKEILGS